MVKVTFDTNILIEVEENRENKLEVLKIIEMKEKNKVNVGIVAVCAIEKKIKGQFINNLNEFIIWLEENNFGNLEIIKTIGRYGLAFWDYCYYGGGKLSDIEKKIYNIIFRKSKIDYLNNNINNKKWRKNIIDTMIFLGHIFNNRDIFITLDNHFLKGHVKEELESIFKTRISRPKEFLEFLN